MKSIWGKVSDFWHVGHNSHDLFAAGVGNVSYIYIFRGSLRTVYELVSLWDYVRGLRYYNSGITMYGHDFMFIQRFGRLISPDPFKFA